MAARSERLASRVAWSTPVFQVFNESKPPLDRRQARVVSAATFRCRGPARPRAPSVLWSASSDQCCLGAAYSQPSGAAFVLQLRYAQRRERFGAHVGIARTRSCSEVCMPYKVPGAAAREQQCGNTKHCNHGRRTMKWDVCRALPQSRQKKLFWCYKPLAGCLASVGVNRAADTSASLALNSSISAALCSSRTA